jgi:threonine-phosphate decarboxylase
MVYNNYDFLQMEVGPLAAQLHGGDVWRWGEQISLDFSASLNPFGMAPEVRAAALEGVARSVHYPDPACAALTAALCAAEDVPEHWVHWGGGAAAVLDAAVAALKPRTALLFDPCFGEYERVLIRHGCALRRCALSAADCFDLTADHLNSLSPEVDLVVLCTPNNPTGRSIAPGILLKMLERCSALDIAVLMDESFLELCDAQRRTDLRPLLGENRKLLLLRSLTKSHCIPGLRLGYALCGHGDWNRALRAGEDPWRVSVPAQLAGVAALGCPDWPKRAMERILPERRRLTDELRKLGCTVWASHANFLLFHVPGDSTLRQRLEGRGILIRSCESFRGLGPDFYRIAVRTPEENTLLLGALEEELTWRNPS